MLQQTQVTTVIPYYQRWIDQFPDWATLAAASEGAVLKAWEGLGYYRRARLLHTLAGRVMTLPGGELPPDPNTLRTLPGIGPYTAGAIASIAFNIPAPAVDGNVERVLARVFDERGDFAGASTRGRIAARAADLIRDDRPSDYTQALMELGALVCLPRTPLCALCPLNSLCARPDPLEVPHKTRIATLQETETLAWIERAGNVVLRPPGTGPRWPDFWKLPVWDPDRMEMDLSLKSVGLTYGITRYRVKAVLQPGSWKGPISNGLEVVPLEQLPTILLPAPHRKLIGLMKESSRSLHRQHPST
ncbi:MAG: hypothetical protein OHK005_14280 [Candidatus Methylacidiphilales bacterium]